MRIETDKKLFTRDEFSRMYEAGILDEDRRYELLDGEIVEMSNPGSRHTACTNRTTKALVQAFGDRGIVSIQNPFVLDDYNEPKPDVVVAKPRADFYDDLDISAEHSILVVEIALTTLYKDRRRKLPIYARLGIPEYWIEDLKNGVLLVYREPAGDRYNTALTLQTTDSIAPLLFPDIVIHVRDLMG